jgi:ribosomal protein S21
MEVHVGRDFEVALKAFTKQVKQSGLVKELKLRSSFESRGERCKRKAREAAMRLKKRQASYEGRRN